MSQQEFFPESQPQNADGAQASQPEAWSVESTRLQRPSDDAPKSEHPSTFEEPVVPYSYPAQDQPVFNTNYGEPAARWGLSAPQPPPPPGPGAASRRYQAYQRPRQSWQEQSPAWQQQQRQQWQQQRYQAPWWARPQPNATQGIPKWIFVVGAILLLLPMLPFLFVVLSFFLTSLLILALIPLLFIVGVIVFVLLFLAGNGTRGPRRRW